MHGKVFHRTLKNAVAHNTAHHVYFHTRYENVTSYLDNTYIFIKFGGTAPLVKFGGTALFESAVFFELFVRHFGLAHYTPFLGFFLQLFRLFEQMVMRIVVEQYEPILDTHRDTVRPSLLRVLQFLLLVVRLGRKQHGFNAHEFMQEGRVVVGFAYGTRKGLVGSLDPFPETRFVDTRASFAGTPLLHHRLLGSQTNVARHCAQ